MEVIIISIICSILSGIIVGIFVYARLQKIEKSNMNLLEQLAKKIDALTVPVNKEDLFRKGLEAQEAEEWDDAIEFFRKALTSAGIKEKAIILFHIGVCFHYQSKYDEALGNYKESLDLAIKIKDKEGEAVNLTNIGLVYFAKGELDKALEYYNKALKIFKEIGMQREIEQTERLIAEIEAKK